MLERTSAGDAFELCPAQLAARDEALTAVRCCGLAVVYADDSRGKTTVMRALHRELGGSFLRAEDFVHAVVEHHPLGIEEAFFKAVCAAMEQSNHVFIDDLQLLNTVFTSCFSYPRTGWFSVVMLSLLTRAAESGRRLIFAGESDVPEPVRARAGFAAIGDFKPADYQQICANLLGTARAALIDFGRVHRYAHNLDAHQLRDACADLDDSGTVTTEGFIEYLQNARLASNVHLDQVRQVELSALRGIDDVIEALENSIVLPLEHDSLAMALGLRPKRGVLLAGPPGTGKTTVGRALAWRLRGKFFLIDGTVIAGSDRFYSEVDAIFDSAEQNAPAVIFIDDADVLFQDSEEQGLYRYLLTKLDGLESGKSGHVCVMLTAMEISSLPPALVRSGRVELWLEMRLPDIAARQAIMQDLLERAPDQLKTADCRAIAERCDGFTGADLTRCVDDARLLLARDMAHGHPLRSATAYLQSALEGAASNKRRYEDALRRAQEG